MSNTSATGGYLIGAAQRLPGNISLEDFIHDFLVGVSGIENPLVRPNWQPNPPKQPDIETNWLAFGITINDTPVNAFVGMGEDDTVTLQRQDNIQVQCSFYGPDALSIARAFRDGLQIQQNLEALYLENMGFKDCSQIIAGPDLINERWVQKYIVTVTLVQQVKRTYEILPFASAEGTIHTVVNNQDLNIPWETTIPEEEEA